MTTTTKLRFDDVKFGVDDQEIARLMNGDPGGVFAIGQDRALKALAMGTEIRAKGYNICVTGLPGTGKQTTVMRILNRQNGRIDRLKDVVLVYNFQRPEHPTALSLAAGEGRRFKKSLHQMVENLKGVIRSKLASGGFNDQRTRILSRLETDEAGALAEFESRLEGQGLRLVQFEEEETRAADIMPVVDGETMDLEAMQRLVVEGKWDETRLATVRERYYRSMDEMKNLLQELRRKRRTAEEELESLKRQAVEMDVQIEVEHLRAEFADPKLSEYFASLEGDILESLYIYAEEGPQRDPSGGPAFVRYGVNVLVDHGDSKTVPVVFETHPDYAALFGAIEMVSDPTGEARTNFMMVRPGALVRASGGFLILRAEDIHAEEDAWNGLKRALQDGRAEIRNAPGPFGAAPCPIKPTPIEIDVKVVILGNENVYDVLYNTDEDFPKLFKVMAEFDSVMDRDEKNTKEFVGFIRKLLREEGLLDADPSGMAGIVEYGVRVAEFRNKLTTRFSMIADLIREADYWARKCDRPLITREVIEMTLDGRRLLHNLPEEKIDEQVLSGEILIQLTGTDVGRINGLAVLDRGYYAFGRPLVISARTAPGHDGIINIERESGLSGEIHDKGILIIGGYLQAQYSRDFPLSIRASICFEQSYIEVDGDSASSAEVYALLSAISGIPLRQDIAVTGSVSQMGEIQPVGAVSEKIEGFYEVCKKTGLTGTQGVAIPRLNIPNLILSREVQEAVAAERFHLYAVSTVDDGMSILTGLAAGARNGKGNYPPASVNGRVEKRLREMAMLVKDFGGN